MKERNPVARQMAYSILLIVLVGSGLSLSLLLTGNRTLAWQLCLGFGVIVLLALLAGAFFVGRSRP
jgi:hypothetical protein